MMTNNNQLQHWQIPSSSSFILSLINKKSPLTPPRSPIRSLSTNSMNKRKNNNNTKIKTWCYRDLSGSIGNNEDLQLLLAHSAKYSKIKKYGIDGINITKHH